MSNLGINVRMVGLSTAAIFTRGERSETEFVDESITAFTLKTTARVAITRAPTSLCAAAHTDLLFGIKVGVEIETLLVLFDPIFELSQYSGTDS